MQQLKVQNQMCIVLRVHLPRCDDKLLNEYALCTVSTARLFVLSAGILT